MYSSRDLFWDNGGGRDYGSVGIVFFVYVFYVYFWDSLFCE